MKKIAIIDIETNGLLTDMLDFSNFPYKLNTEARLWTVVVTDLLTQEVFVKENEEITREWLKEVLAPYDTIVAHNGVKFDLVVLQLFGVLDYRIGFLREKDLCFGKEVRFLDSLILSRLLAPDRFGGHSLESWGERLGEPKTDYRKSCIEAGYIDAKSPKGSEFGVYTPLLKPYCIQDTIVGGKVFKNLWKEIHEYGDWGKAIKVEHKLADLAIRREVLGFSFDKELAIKSLNELTDFMEELQNKVNPLLPLKKMNKTEISDWTPPKTQFKKDGSPSANLLKFVEKVGGELENFDGVYYLKIEDKVIELPTNTPVKEFVEADISNLDHVKGYLIELGWVPTEWRIRDLTKDSKKQNLSYEKRVAALKRYLDETFSGKYRKARIEQFEVSPELAFEYYSEKLKQDRPVRVPTSPCVRVGVVKELCPNLVSLGEKVEFAKDFALYLTYKHRKSCIAGGDVEEMDLDEESPNTGYLANFREIDGRIPTPAIEIGAASNRYRHISIANVPRASSIYGKEMRSLFGCGKDAIQLGFDFSSLENRIQGHYVHPYEFGEELAISLIAEKPDDLHTLNSIKLNITRDSAKSITYAILYGCSPNKLEAMLGLDKAGAEKMYDDFWESVPALKNLKLDLEEFWKGTGSKYVVGIDGRKIFTRSKHSLLNYTFQSGGVICAKYVTVLLFDYLEKLGYCIDPFKGNPDVCSMIEYHDENQLRLNPSLVRYQTFETEEEGKEFIKNWKGEQLGSLSFGRKWFVALPNVVSINIQKAIEETEKLMGLRVPLGMEYVVGRTWYDCH